MKTDKQESRFMYNEKGYFLNKLIFLSFKSIQTISDPGVYS